MAPHWCHMALQWCHMAAQWYHMAPQWCHMAPHLSLGLQTLQQPTGNAYNSKQHKLVMSVEQTNYIDVYEFKPGSCIKTIDCIIMHQLRGGLKKPLIFGLLAKTRGGGGVSGGPKGPILLTVFFPKISKMIYML
jgi:hypothetical protein